MGAGRPVSHSLRFTPQARSELAEAQPPEITVGEVAGNHIAHFCIDRPTGQRQTRFCTDPHRARIEIRTADENPVIIGAQNLGLKGQALLGNGSPDVNRTR